MSKEKKPLNIDFTIGEDNVVVDGPIAIQLPLTVGIRELMDADVAMICASKTELIRRIVSWHRGTGSPREGTPVSWPFNNAESVVGVVFVDRVNVEYLDRLALETSIERATVLQLLICQWFGFAILPPGPYRTFQQSWCPAVPISTNQGDCDD